MDISIVAIGRMKKGPEAELCARYLDRAAKSGRAHGLAGFGVTELPEARDPRPAGRMASEAAALSTALPAGAALVCLHEGGDDLGSEAFARWLAEGAATGRSSLAFVIGGSDGLDPDFLRRAERRIAFGRMTWPHQIVRILLAEQLYRATTILSHHPYHRA